MTDNIICPVCGHEQSETQYDCTVCGWDHRKQMGGNLEAAKQAHDERLSKARAAVAVPYLVDGTPADVVEILQRLEASMVVIPSGEFLLGSPASEPERLDDEGPQQRVQIEAFELSCVTVSFAQWDACVKDGGTRYRPDDEDGRGDQPVIYVSYNDIVKDFIPWLNKKTGKGYRLPSEAEWEYAARAGTITRYNTGDCISRDQANFNGKHPAEGCPKGSSHGKILPVQSLEPNGFGLYQMHGNVWEWTADAWNWNHTGHPGTNAARMSADAEIRVIRGGSKHQGGMFVRSAYRNFWSVDNRDDDIIYIGFRLARSL